MNQKLIYTLLISLLTLIIAACDSRSARLRAIDDIIESDPEAAYEALESLNHAEFSPVDSAYFALLYTQAQIKCKIPVPSDTLINLAYDRFIHSRSDDLRKRAAFYKARVAYGNQQLPEAMKDVLIAYEIAKDHNDHYWIAKSAELIGDIYFDSYNFWQAEPYTAEAAREYLTANKILNHRYALCDLAITLFNIGDYERGIHIADSLQTICLSEQPEDSNLFNYIEPSKCAALVETQQFEKLPTHLQIFYKNGVDAYITQSKISLSASDIYNSRNLLFNAYCVAENIEETARVMYADFQQSLIEQDFSKAATLGDSLLSLQGYIADQYIKNSITGIQRDFYEHKAATEKANTHNTLIILIITILSATLLIALLICIYRLKLHARESELESFALSLKSLKERTEKDIQQKDLLNKELQTRNEEISSLKRQLDNNAGNSRIIEYLFHQSWRTLNMLCDEYFNIGDSKHAKISVLNNIEKELKTLSSKKNIHNIEMAVDTYMGNIMSMIRDECSFLNESDFNFLTLVFAGLSVRSVCIFLNIKYKYFYLRKSRLVTRILNSDARHKLLFIEKLTKNLSISD